MIESILTRMSPLGVILRPTGRGRIGGVVANPAATPGGCTRCSPTPRRPGGPEARRGRFLAADPATHPPRTLAADRHFPQLSVRQDHLSLERPIGGNVHRLRVESELNVPVVLQVGTTRPGLAELGPWHAAPTTPEPSSDSATGRLCWSIRLPLAARIGAGRGDEFRPAFSMGLAAVGFRESHAGRPGAER